MSLQMTMAIAWCLSSGNPSQSQSIAAELQSTIPSLHSLQTSDDVSQWFDSLSEDQAKYWNSEIGLVYGGATKIKDYLFESVDLQEIRGASALLDRINIVDLPAFFHAEQGGDRFQQCHAARYYCQQIRGNWLHQNFPDLEHALIPELIVYSTGGNILAFCPAPLVDQLANAIEKRYAHETLTANACVVGRTFKAAEIYLGLLKDRVSETTWLDSLKQNNFKSNLVVQAYFGFSENDDDETIAEKFFQRKGFSELAGLLANQFNQRRSGHEIESTRPSRRYPPMFETHPYLVRDDSDRRSAVATKVTRLPDTPNFSEPTARKRRVGQITKRDKKVSGQWYAEIGLNQSWDPLKDTREVEDAEFRSWVSKFESFLCDPQRGHLVETYDSHHAIFDQNWRIKDPYKREARSLTEIGDASNGFVAYIYADGNNMGQYIRDQLKTPENYQRFSEDVFEATQESVYWALAHHIKPHSYKPDAKSSRDNKDWVSIHPFEIITIGGDDVLLIVPANTALEVAKTIGERFESILMQKTNKDRTKRYELEPDMIQNAVPCHRYKSDSASASNCCLSISSGVLITAENTPIYYADRLVTQLLKSAKKKAKDLRDKPPKGTNHYGGTVDVLTLKAVTMISSNVESFRQEGLTFRFLERQQDLKLYATPYTLHELGGLIETVRAIKKANFPRSQLYQIRSLLERGKRTAILNYRYFRVRLSKEDQDLLKHYFENAWCTPLDEENSGNLAPWMTLQRKDTSDSEPEPEPGTETETESETNKTIYETLWRELVELYPFVDLLDKDSERDDNQATQHTESLAESGEGQS